MAATAEALVQEERPDRPDLRVVRLPGGRRERRRLVARRRLAVLAAVAATALVTGVQAASVFVEGGPGRSESGSAPAQPADGLVVVTPGDTVWDLAREHLPEGTRPGDYVTEIVEANQLDPTALQPGTVVRLPSP